MDANLVRRVGFAVVAIPLALGLVWFGGLPLALLLAVAAALATRELFGLAERRQVRPATIPGILTSAAIAPVTWAALSTEHGPTLATVAPYIVALWLLGLLTWALVARGPADRPLEAVGVTWLAVAYAGALPAFLLIIRHSQHPLRSWAGAWLVFFPLIVTWICDTAAMFGGRTFGGPKLAPTISPGKTRSGTLAGIVGGVLVAPLFGGYVFPAVGVTVAGWQLFAIAGVLSVVGQVGDLAESLFKREAGVKDSSALIPGHGGVLDRLDSLYFVVPVAAAMYHAFGVI
jgi:phosphatidate cytidylyltransferase